MNDKKNKTLDKQKSGIIIGMEESYRNNIVENSIQITNSHLRAPKDKDKKK